MSHGIVSLGWFHKLRLFAAFCQTLLVLFAYRFLHVEFSVPILLSLIVLIPVSELCIPAIRRVLKGELLLGCGLLLLDTFILTGLLAFSGGAANPFSIVYFLHVVLAAVLFGKHCAWLIAFVTISCFGALFFIGGNAHHAHMAHGNYSVHLAGMFFSYCTVVIASTYFLGKIVDEFRSKESELLRLEADQEKLVTMTALSTNAAHELSTPLATIELIAHELSDASSNDLPKEISALKVEVARCKSIISEICVKAGNPKADPIEQFTLQELSFELKRSLTKFVMHIDWMIPENTMVLKLPKQSVLIALKALVDNALEASVGSSSKVLVSFDCQARDLTVTVADSGSGMTKNQLDNLGTAFFSGKETGMGLGVYIAKLIAQQLDGTLNYSSKLSHGTSVTFRVPQISKHAKGLVV